MFRMSKGERLFQGLNLSVLTVLSLAAVYPFVYTLNISLSSAAEANRLSLHLWPGDFTFASYIKVLSTPEIMRATFNSVMRTVVGTILTLLLTCMAAYPLAIKELPHRSMIIFLLVFTMLFGGGLVPSFLLINNLGLANTFLVLLLPMLVSAMNIIIVRNFFLSLPYSMREAAMMDGANDWSILFKIYVPLSKPVLATVGLWTAVGFWNEWFLPLMYITDHDKQVLQTLLQRIVINNSTYMMDKGMGDVSATTAETIKSATIMLVVVPIILIYPFLQKYFVKGINLGGVKE